MATAGVLIDDILRRVRDPQGAATSRAQVLDLLDRCQIVVVRQTGTLIRDRTVTFPSAKLIHKIDTAAVLRIVDIYNASTDKRLSRMRWSALVQVNTRWWRETNTAGPTSWAPLGSNYFLIYPGLGLVSFQYTLREQLRPAELTAEEVELELPTEHHHILVDLVEALVLLRSREDSLKEALDLLEAAHGQS